MKPLIIIFTIVAFFSAEIVNEDLIKIVPSKLNGVLKLDFELSDPMNHFHIDKVWACSSVDIEMDPYDKDMKDNTGCNTDGFISEQIYGVGTKDIVESSFRAELRYRTMLLHEGILDERTPVVYIQVKLRVTNSFGDPIDGGEVVRVIARYTNLQPEKEENRSYEDLLKIDPKIQENNIIQKEDNVDAAAMENIHWYYLTFGGLGVCTIVVLVGFVVTEIKKKLVSNRRANIYIGWDMETGESYGSGLEKVGENRTVWQKFAYKQGIWRRKK